MGSHYIPDALSFGFTVLIHKHIKEAGRATEHSGERPALLNSELIKPGHNNCKS
jgi:hypothetical protein